MLGVEGCLCFDAGEERPPEAPSLLSWTTTSTDRHLAFTLAKSLRSSSVDSLVYTRIVLLGCACVIFCTLAFRNLTELLQNTTRLPAATALWSSAAKAPLSL